MTLQTEHMPGPTDEARVIQLLQWNRRTSFYGALNKFEGSSPEVSQARVAYEETVVQLEALLGSGAHCNTVDCDLWSMFSDYYKDVVGCRPHGVPFTRSEVLTWIQRQSSQEQLAA